ncbi:MAG: hypothetical protein AAGI11_04305 [Pseudomonadota bacterium]
MLNEASYQAAMLVYLGSAVLALLYMAWLSRGWRPIWLALLLLPSAALLLTPAYPQEGVETLAPALVVVTFQVLTAGVDAAEHALRPLLLFTGLAVIAALVIGFLGRRRRIPSGEEDKAGEAPA